MILSESTDLVKRASIEELIGHRNRALEMYRQGAECIRAGNRALSLAAPSETYPHLDRDMLEQLGWDVDEERAARFMAAVRKKVDRFVWSHLLIATGLGELMDSLQKEEFRKQIQNDPPECTVETCAATCLDLAGRAPEIFERSVCHVFERLARRFKSHDGFKLGPRIILQNAISGFGWYSGSHWSPRDSVDDLDRVMHILDGKNPPDRMSAAGQIVNTAHSQGRREAETPYFRFRWFKNGCIHIYLLREDLREKANRIIAKQHANELGRQVEAA